MKATGRLQPLWDAYQEWGLSGDDDDPEPESDVDPEPEDMKDDDADHGPVEVDAYGSPADTRTLCPICGAEMEDDPSYGFEVPPCSDCREETDEDEDEEDDGS